MGILPVALFASGHTYFVQRLHEQMGLEPFAVHATFQYSGTPGKRHRMRERMLWLAVSTHSALPFPLLCHGHCITWRADRKDKASVRELYSRCPARLYCRMSGAASAEPLRMYMRMDWPAGWGLFVARSQGAATAGLLIDWCAM